MPTPDEISRMSYEELGNLNPSSMSREERRAARDRALRLEAQQSNRRDLGLAARTVASGLLGLPAGLLDAAQWVGRNLDPYQEPLRRALGQESENMFDASGALERGLDYVGLPRPEGFGENLSYDIGSNLIGTLAPMGALRALPSLAARLGSGISRFITERPALQSAMAVTGGAGQAVAGEVTDHDPWAEVGGGVLGALAPLAVTGAGGALRGANAARQTASRRQARDVLRETANDPEGLVSRIDANVDPLVDATRPLSEVTGDPRFAALERQIIQDAEAGQPLRDQAEGRNTARTRALEDAAPGSAGPEAVSQELRSQIDDLDRVTTEALNDSRIRVTGRIRDAGAEPIPGVSPAEAAQGRGTVVRDALERERQLLEERAGIHADAVDPREQSRLVTSQLVDDLDGHLANNLRTLSPGDPDAGAVRRLVAIRDFIQSNSAGDRVPFALLDRQREALDRIALHARSQRVADTASAMARSIEERARAAAEVPGLSNLTAADLAAAEARDAARARAGRLYDQGPVGSVLARNVQDVTRVAPENVAARLTPADRMPGAATAPQQAIDAMAGDTAGMQALQNDLAGRIVNAARRGEDIDPAVLRKAIDAHSQTLSSFPELKQSLENLHKEVERHDLLSRLSGQARDASQSGPARAWLGEVDINNAMQRMLGNGAAQQRVAEELMRRLGSNPDAIEGARRSFRDMLLERAQRSVGGRSGGELNLTGLSKAFDQYKDAAGVILGRAGAQRVQAVMDDIRSELANAARSAGTKLPAQDRTRSAASRVAWYLAKHAAGKVIGMPGWMRSIISHVTPQRGANPVVVSMVGQALADPKFARELLMTPAPDRMAYIARAIDGSLQAGRVGAATEGRQRE